MATLAVAAARRATTLTRIYSPTTSAQAGKLIQRRGLAAAADHHGTPKVNCWLDPMSPSKWKEEHLLKRLACWIIFCCGIFSWVEWKDGHNGCIYSGFASWVDCERLGGAINSA